MDWTGNAFKVYRRRRRSPRGGREALGALQRGPLTAGRLVGAEVLVGENSGFRV